MSVVENIGADKFWIIGENKILVYEILQDDGKKITDATKGVEDVSTWDFVWVLASITNGIISTTPKIEKRIGTGIEVTGIFNASRGTNTQRVEVTIDDTDTDNLRAGTYALALKRLAAGGDAVLQHGTVTLVRTAAPAE